MSFFVSQSNKYAPIYPTVGSAPAADVIPAANVATVPTPVYAKIVLSSEQHIQTDQLLSKAAQLADSILPRSKPHAYNPYVVPPQAATTQATTPAAPSTIFSRVSPIHLDLSDKSIRVLNNDTRNETHVHHQSQDQQSEIEKQKQKEKNQRLIFGFIGVVIMATTAFFVGKAIAENEGIQKESSSNEQSFENLKKKWETNKICYDFNYINAVDDVLTPTEEILARAQTRRVHHMALLVLSFIAGTTAFTGALISSGPLMTASLAVGGCVGVVALFRLGYTYFSSLDQLDAEAIERAFVKLNQLPVPQPVVV